MRILLDMRDFPSDEIDEAPVPAGLCAVSGGLLGLAPPVGPAPPCDVLGTG